jgi:hypothetical protein
MDIRLSLQTNRASHVGLAVAGSGVEQEIIGMLP